MKYPDFFDTIETIKLEDDLSLFLGTFEHGKIEFSYLDIVKAAGHSCPTVAGAYIITLVALKKLFKDETPKRGKICVSFQEDSKDGATGVIANVISLVTGATEYTGFKGIQGNFQRYGLMKFNAKLNTSIKFQRIDTCKTIELSYNPNNIVQNPLIPKLMKKIMTKSATSEEKKKFGILWQDRVATIFENIDNLIEIKWNKKNLKIALIGLFAISILNAKDEKKPEMRYQAVPAQKATIVQKGDSKKFCPICGMTLPMFYKTNHAANHEGHSKQYCSVHCLVEDKEINGAKLSDEKVVDNKTLKFIDAKNAYYVVGSKKPGTMSMVSKYGFANESDAQAFQKANGGEIKKYDEVYKIVAKGMEKERAMIAKRQAKAAKMGGKIYGKMCKKIDMTFKTPADAKTYLTKNKTCGEMKGKSLQQVALYLSGR